MAGRIRKDDIDALRDRVDIADIVGDHTKLTRSGARLKGLCPFHQEKTPSFSVDPAQSMYHCFGCGVGGDVYTFLQEVEGLSFVEAVEQLARRVGYTLQYEEMTAGERRQLGEHSVLVDVNQAALAFFQGSLLGADGEVARAYLKERGFGRADAERFQLGFAPNEWEALSRHLISEGYDQRRVIEAGLAVNNERGGLRDRFRGRLVFPVLDLAGDPIGFGGRILPALDHGDFDPPKYLNSPETPLYRKTKVLYGASWARPQIVREGTVLICEGYTDVMALHQAGYTNAVATCGTAVTGEHLRLLQRYAQHIVLAFDSDAAGAKAAERAWELSREHDLDVRVLVLPAGKDPADLVREDGADRLQELVAGATPVTPFLLDRRISEHDLGSHEGQAAAVDAVAPLLAKVDDATLRRQYAEKLVADRVGVSLAVVAAKVEQAGGDVPGISEPPRRGTGRAGGGGRPRGEARRGGTSRPDREVEQRRRQVALERDVLSIALQRPELLPETWFELESDDFTHEVARAVFDALQAAGGPGTVVSAVLEAAPDDELRGKLRELALREVEVDPDEPHVHVLVKRLVARRLEERIETRRGAVRTMNYTTDPDAYLQASRELEALERTRRELLGRD
ncbi:MAG TPA: DNA primase [Nitriliruptorales bacterium]